MKTGVVDVGGGFRGIYACGVLDYCMDENIRFDLGMMINETWVADIFPVANHGMRSGFPILVAMLKKTCYNVCKRIWFSCFGRVPTYS